LLQPWEEIVAKLPPIDVNAFWIRDLLHRGQREEALTRLERVIATGRAGAETLALAEFLKRAKRGRPPFGATHLWYSIGAENDEMRCAGATYEQRMDRLGAKYMLARTQVETAVAKYEAGMEAIRLDERY
jgi:hypothetical protein